MERLIEYFIDKSKLVLFIFLMIFLVGTSSYNSIPKESTPNITIPTVYVTVSYTGISNEDSEKYIAKPLEKYLKNIDNLKKIRSYSSNGYAVVSLEFLAGFDIKQALIDVREKVNQAKRDLPNDADEPIIQEVNLSTFPVLNIILTSNINERSMIKLVDKLKDAILLLPDVLKVNVIGYRKEQIDLIILPEKLYAYGIKLNEVRNILTGNLALFLSTSMNNKGSKFLIKIPSIVDKFEDLVSVPLVTINNRTIFLRDIVSVKRTFEEKVNIARANSDKAYVLEVSKKTGSNIINTIESVKATVAELQKTWPESINLIYSNDDSQNIKDMLNDLLNSILLAIIVALIPIIMTMGMKSAFLVTLSIPTSFLMGMIFLDYMSFSLNTIILFSLILSVGMLVDAAIVVCEYADRKMVEGYSSYDAFKISAKKMLWPVVSSVATTIIVFVPLLFWPGIIGEFMKYLPITMIAVLIASLIVAFIFVPVIGIILKKNDVFTNEEKKQILASSEEGDINNLNNFTKLYYNLLTKVIDKPGKFCFGLLIMSVTIVSLYVFLGKGVELFPDIEPERFGISVHALGNYTLDESDVIFKEIESKINSTPNKDFKVMYTRFGSLDNIGEVNTLGKIDFELKKWNVRRKAGIIQSEYINLLKDIKGIEIKTYQERSGPTSGKPINIKFLTHTNFKGSLDILAKTINKLKSMPNITNIETNDSSPVLEWRISMDPNLMSINGVNPTDTSDIVQMLGQGVNLTKIRLFDLDEEIDIRLKFPESDKYLHFINFMGINNNFGFIPITNFAKILPAKKTNTIYRESGLREYYISCDVRPGVVPDVELKNIKDWLKTQKIEDDITLVFGGDEENIKETQEFLGMAFNIAMFGILVIFLIQFNSFYYSFIIMSAIILSTIGVLVGLLVTMRPFGVVMCGIGLIALAGTVVNNNIIFIDTFLEFDKNIPIKQRILLTGIQRIRPILLTASTAVLGLLPMVLAINIDIFDLDVSVGAPSSQWWTQLSTAISGGLAFATILTLFFTPALLMVGDNIRSNSKIFQKIMYLLRK